jgi:hypothetical protein
MPVLNDHSLCASPLVTTPFFIPVSFVSTTRSALGPASFVGRADARYLAEATEGFRPANSSMKAVSIS